jgi:Ankyrin repeats (3 copies)
MFKTGLLAITLFLASCGSRTATTPLIQAARDGRVDLIPALVKQGADPNQRAGVNGWTPLMHAIHKNQQGSIAALLDAGADVNSRGADGSTALMMAAGYGYTDIVSLLLERGADPHAQLSDGSNALTFAVLGTPDIDRFTVMDCQGPTVKALLGRAPDLRVQTSPRVLNAVASLKVKSCMLF